MTEATNSSGAFSGKRSPRSPHPSTSPEAHETVWPQAEAAVPVSSPTVAIPAKSSPRITRASRATETREQDLRGRAASWSTWLRAVGGLVAGLLLWWPFSYLGLADFLRLPAGAGQVGTILAGALAASGVAALLVRAPWPRFLVTFGFPVLCVLQSGGFGAYPVPVLLLLLAVVMTGIAVGAYGTGSTMTLALSLAFLVGMSPGSLWKGPFIAVALAVPFARAALDRVAPTVLGVVAVVGLWLLGAVTGHGLIGGFATEAAQRASGFDLVKTGLADSFTAARTDASVLIQNELQAMTGWFIVAAVLVALIVLTRAITGRGASKQPAKP